MDEAITDIELNQISENISNQLQSELQVFINSYLPRIQQWIRKSISVVDQLQKDNKDLQKLATEYAKQNSQIYKRLRTSRKENLSQSLLKDGYELALELFSFFNHTSISYQLVVTIEKKKYTIANVTQEQFMQLISTSNRRIFLKSPATILKIMQSTNNNIKEWSDKDIKSYESFYNYIKKQPQWLKLNEGNILEGYLRWRQNKSQSKYDSMQETLKNTARFYQGGDLVIDLQETQIKGNDASVTNINTLLNLFSPIMQIFISSNLIDQSIIKKQWLNEHKTELNSTIQDNILEKVKTYFTKSKS